ncbi:plasmid pRiA4b ORF-3 family protein [Actinoplanes sp. TBRC 11911]|uniref:plasmid pRiA4b ORF-3 family protein n=1 Tax=Actinoplanes sp. TBRC 11911 TaxID=2729386 RepID=UPI001B7D61EB|nr:plasmid pRiA4b ORF-3 family protein [Actinoplanes sp. TBRC 11911]
MTTPPDECDCPACSGMPLDAEEFLDDLLDSAADLVALEDPLDVELFGATVIAAGELAGEASFREELTGGIIPALAAAATPESLALLLAIDAVHPGQGASDAARSLTGAGVTAPAWQAAMARPMRLTVSRRYGDLDGEASMLLCVFERSGHSHGFIVHVDHTDCDAAADIITFPGELLDEVTGMIQDDARRSGVTLSADDLDPGEFRWQVERALDARAVHDREGPPELDAGDEDGPGYPTLAVVLRARMAILPEPPRPPAPHGDGRPVATAPIPMPSQRRSSTTLPAKRRKSGGPAPIYQIKVGLRGAKPPIWRRLEVPGDIGLADLHLVIQVAFGWNGGHLHVFETPYGSFGVADPELEHLAEAPVTLEQVAPAAGDRIQYLYDFGDDWDHDIRVEKLLDRQAVAYPRCTGGRRAAPPDDCGGIWAYTEILEILADPDHPDHDERLEWLDLESADEFRPDEFDAAAVTRLLTAMR